MQLTAQQRRAAWTTIASLALSTGGLRATALSLRRASTGSLH
jgi:hypothetical protein